MNQLDLLLPFGLPPEEMARDLLRELKMPALATLLARATRLEHHVSDGFSRALPHETWLATRSGLTVNGSNDTSPPLAAGAMQGMHQAANEGFWFILQPAHLHVARDHLVLTDLRQLKLAEQDAHILFDIAKPLFEESGKTLLYGDAKTWFLRADNWEALHTSTPDAACGHNIDIWMPKGPNEREWRRLQNEIQMHWHDHPINDRRETSGLKPVNSVWLWGGTSISEKSSEHKFEEAFTLKNQANWYAPLAAKQLNASSAAEVIAARPQHGLLVLDSLIESALAGDWSEWLGAFHTLETQWFAPLLDAVQSGRLAQLSLTINHNTALTTYTVSKSSLRKFWRKSSLARLVP